MLKTLFTITSVFFLFSCSVINQNNIAPGYTQAYSAIKSSIFGSDNEIDENLIKSIPYASMIVRIGNGPRGLMILESKSGNEYTWVSADGVYLVIKEGRIIQSEGLINNLDEINSSYNFWKNPTYKERVNYFSFSNPEFNNLKVFSSSEELGNVEVDLKLQILELRLIEENIYAPLVGWSEVNKYWLDNDNFVWKSHQNISPNLPVISYIVTKKPR